MRFLALAIALLLVATVGWMVAAMDPHAPKQALDRPLPGALEEPDSEPVDLAPVAPPDPSAQAQSRSEATESLGDPAVLASRAMMTRPIPSNRAGLVVVVRGVDGPIEGAIVTIDGRVGPQFAGEVDAEGHARTNADGKARFFVRSMLTIPVAAMAPDQSSIVSTTITSPRDGDERVVDLMLTSATVGGVQPIVVLDERTRRPIAAARIKVRSTGGSLVRLATDGSGKASLPAVATSTADIEHDGYQTRTIEQRTEISESRVEVTLRRPARLYGTLAGISAEHPRSWSTHIELRQIGDQPLLGERNEKHLLMERVSRDGTWSIDSVEIPYDVAELKRVRVIHRDGDFVRALADSITLTPDSDQEILDPWQGAPPWTIAVVHEDGTSATPGVTVELECLEAEIGAPGQVLSAQTGHGGAVTLKAFPKGLWEARIRVPLANAGAVIRERFRHDGSGDARITLKGCSRLEGRVDRSKRDDLGRVRIEVVAGDRRVELSLFERDLFRYELAPSGTIVTVRLMQQTEEIDRSSTRDHPFVWRPVAEMNAVAGDLDIVLIAP